MNIEKVAVIGLGYVGLPLAVEIGKQYHTIGFDINDVRINELKEGTDRTLEVPREDLKGQTNIIFTSDTNELKDADLFIITVPTPIDEYKIPDLTPLRSASRMVGPVMKKGSIVVYESTVFPGCTEEICVPILEEKSGMKFNVDFYAGYSPERINPGDKERRVTNIQKVVSGSTPEIADLLNKFYQSIITAGTHLTSSIKVAEASKVIENAQRDINIAFVNELALIFDRLSIDTKEVLEAAGTKWNFLKFSPGLVGGHCIGVDPYYLTYKAEELGYHPQVILAGRRINDNMGNYVAQSVIKEALKNKINLGTATFLLLGITFKENCPDIRNSRVIDIYNELKEYDVKVDVYDPHADAEEVKHEYGIDLIEKPTKKYSGIILAVSHDDFSSLDIAELKEQSGVVYDVKGFLPKESVSKRL
ncbi:MAG: nucleotide sugar dehydrogenase [Cyclobacteriaceae bacterium]